MIVLWITLVQSCREKLISGDRQYGVLDVTFEDGTNLSFWDVYYIIKSYWNNAEFFNWQEGDILVLDNHRVGHSRLPFTGERKVYTAMV